MIVPGKLDACPGTNHPANPGTIIQGVRRADGMPWRNPGTIIQGVRRPIHACPGTIIQGLQNVTAQIHVLSQIGKATLHIFPVQSHRLRPDFRRFKEQVFQQFLHDGM